MSLNRIEQALHDYVIRHPEERQFVRDKVRAIAAENLDPHDTVVRLDTQLWRYYEERSRVVPAFKEAAATFGLKRTSMKNLAELLIRLWTDPRTKKVTPEDKIPPQLIV